MKVFTCGCTWSYILNKKGTKVIGPIYDGLGSRPHIGHQETMTYKEWEEQYGDCVANYERYQKKGAQ